MREKFIDLTLFVALCSLPLIFIMLIINSWNPEERDKQYLKEVISRAYFDLSKDSPIIKQIKDKNKLPPLDFSQKISNGDYIYIYKIKPVAIFMNPKSSEIIGISIIK